MLNVTVCTVFFLIDGDASTKGTINFFLNQKNSGHRNGGPAKQKTARTDSDQKGRGFGGFR